MSTKTSCCIGSDADLLSKVQLDEVLAILEGYGSKHSIEFTRLEESSHLRSTHTLPNTPARVSLLMRELLEGKSDALALDATTIPTKIPSGLTIGAITSRMTPYDALISTAECIIDELRDGAVVHAGSARREAQLLYYRSDLTIVNARGSLDALIQKVKGGKLDAAVVAASDMERLNRQDYVVELLTNSVCVPAAGQGALAILIRSSEDRFKESIQTINDPTSYSTLRAEWAFLEHLGVDNQAPIGVLGTVVGKVLELEGVLALPDGREKIHFLVKGKLGAEEDLGRTLAQEILEAGGKEILEELDLF